MASRQQPSMIVHPTGLKRRCASGRRYAVARVAIFTRRWNTMKQAYDEFDTPQRELLVVRRTDSLPTARVEFNRNRGLQPIIWDLDTNEIIASGR